MFTVFLYTVLSFWRSLSFPVIKPCWFSNFKSKFAIFGLTTERERVEQEVQEGFV